MLKPDVTQMSWPPLIRYGLALTLFFFALLLRFTLVPAQVGFAFVTFYPAIIISFYLFGSGSGILVAMLSGFAEAYFFMPSHELGTDFQMVTSLAFFVVTSLLMGFIITRLHDYREEQKELKSKLIENERHHALLFNSSPVGIFATDRNGKCTFVNERWSSITGLSLEVAKGDGWASALHPEDRNNVFKEWAASTLERRPFRLEYRFLRPEGTIVWVIGQSDSYWSEIGDVLGYIGTVTDITDRKIAEEKLTNKEEQLRFVLEGSELGFWDWDIVTGTVERNERWAVMLGYTFEEINNTTQQWTDFIHPDDRANSWRSINNVLEGRSTAHKYEYRMLHKDGSIRWILDQAKVMMRDEHGIAIRMSGTHTDITERKGFEVELQRQAHMDFLTELNSRGHFMSQAELELTRAIRYDNPLSLLIMDIDFFKQINDTHGHKAGDTVLIKLAEACRQILREVDIIGRVGGEEFAILLPETDMIEAFEVAERLRTALADSKIPLSEGGVPLQFTVSIGLTSLSSKEDTIGMLLNLADMALYEAKNSGRNKVCSMLRQAADLDLQ